MYTKYTIEQVVNSQSERLLRLAPGLPRELTLPRDLSSHALIISGIRRCGKSTLLQQIHTGFQGTSVYLNFEDPRLAGFDLEDFNRLHELVVEKGINAYFLDEIQNVSKWESFVRFRLDESYRIFITGSNASMLSKDLGTKLTGRHITKELFPFSFSEYLAFTGLSCNAKSSELYLKTGGFPEYLKTSLPEVMMQTFNDIIVRDISVRYGLKHISVMQQLALWLITNVGKPITGNSLRKIFGINSSSSMMDYLSYFSDAYLFFFIPRFSYSRKAQLVNPKKVYCVDNGLVDINSVSFSDDSGRLLENMVFMQLRRHSHEIYYFLETKECDFVLFYQGKLKGLFQVCLVLDQNNTDREISGLAAAMDFFRINEGYIVTLNQTETFSIKEKTIHCLPFCNLMNSKMAIL